MATTAKFYPTSFLGAFTSNQDFVQTEFYLIGYRTFMMRVCEVLTLAHFLFGRSEGAKTRGTRSCAPKFKN